MSIPRFAWQQLGTSPENGNLRPPLFFIPEANLAFIDVKGNYTVLSYGPGGINPPRLDTQEYLDVLKKKPGLNFKVVDDAGGEEQLLVLQPIALERGQPLGVVQVSTLTRPLKELLIRQLLTFLFLRLAESFNGMLERLEA